MNKLDLLSLAFRNLMRRKTRTILAIIGVMVGVCAVIVMVSIGFGLSASFTSEIEKFGNLHMIQVYQGGGTVTGQNGEKVQAKLNDKTLTSFEKIDGVTAVTPTVDLYMTVGWGKKVTSGSIKGIKPEFMEKMNYEMLKGRSLQKGDEYQLVFGKNAASWFYDPRGIDNTEVKPEDVVDRMVFTANNNYGRPENQIDPQQETPDYKEYQTECVGVLANENDETSYNIYMSLDTALKVQKETQIAEHQSVSVGETVYNQALVYVDDIDKVQAACNVIKDKGFQTYSLTDQLKTMQNMARMIQMILGGIGAISLFVAAIGIMNTMFMSINERKKEIGVMKVIGANLNDIRMQFLLEAGMIGLGGGILGTIVSYGISFLMNMLLGGIFGGLGLGMGGDAAAKVSIIPWQLALGAMAFAALVGVISGYVPASKAMKTSVLESLRNE